MHKTLKVVAVLATISILLVVLAGAVVTKTGSGDGCGPNWPLCHGKLIPENPTLETVIEYTHRLITLVAGIIILVFSLWSAIQFRKNREILLVSCASLFFLFLQSALGAMAVVYGQSSAVLALHFGFSLLSYASIFILMMHIFKINTRLQLPTSTTEKGLRWGLIALFIGTYGVVYLGAYVRHTGSVLGCQGWPLCSGYVIPPLTGQMGIQFTHRFAAFLLFLSFIWLVVHAYKHYRHDRTIVRQSVWLLLFLFLEIISGGIVVLSNINNYASLIHALIITLMFGLQCYLTLYVFRRDKVNI